MCASALRVFVKSPGFSLVVVATLALGIGANTAIFEILDAVRLRTLPIAKPGELAAVRIVGGNRGFGINDNEFTDFTVPMWQEVKEHHDPFSGVFAWRTDVYQVGFHGESHRVNVLEVSGDFFNVLGIVPWQGRLIEPQDETGCQITRVVASYSFWKSQMGGKPITANTTILAEGRSVQVLGVTPPSFFGMVVGDGFDLAYPTCTPANPRREAFVYSVMGRLKPGWSFQRASEYFNALSPGLFAETAPEGYSSEALKTFKSYRLATYPAGAGVSYLRDQYNSSLEILLAITGLVLLIACANLANLMLARASVKRRDVAVRMALGASRGRLLRQTVLESALLAVCGTVLGAAIAQPLSRALVASLDTSESTIHLAIVVDWRVLLFAAAAATATCVIFGTLPALRNTRLKPLTSLKSGERGVAGDRERFSVQRAMVITQIAVSMVLLVGALLVRAQLSQFVDTESRHAREGDRGRLSWFLVGEYQTRIHRGLQKATCGRRAQPSRHRKRRRDHERSSEGLHLGTRSGDRLGEWAEQIYIRFSKLFRHAGYSAARRTELYRSGHQRQSSGADRKPGLCPEVC